MINLDFLDKKQHKLLEFVIEKHGDQVRKYTNEPYWTHPVSVAKLYHKYCKENYGVSAALCHDLLEDTNCTKEELISKICEIGYDDLESTFIADLVDDLTDKFTKEKFPNLNRKERKLREAVRLGGVRFESQNIKLCDLIDNTSSITIHDPNFSVVYMGEKKALLANMKNNNIDIYIKCCSIYQNWLDSKSVDL
jgi:(p)ppGpp synthase/HD superfamily hydrolase